ncbi:restriction endonuclease [Lysinibacillus sphaericus]|uniref:restriction endonuclease n=1 Tax=Lysinibacillus sphaericus TaxID=1421 RepID=UPI00381E6613
MEIGGSVLPPIQDIYIRPLFWQRNIARSDIRDIDLIDGFQFEASLKVMFSRSGYHVTVKPKSSDYGADIVLNKGEKDCCPS